MNENFFYSVRSSKPSYRKKNSNSKFQVSEAIRTLRVQKRPNLAKKKLWNEQLSIVQIFIFPNLIVLNLKFGRRCYIYENGHYINYCSFLTFSSHEQVWFYVNNDFQNFHQISTFETPWVRKNGLYGGICLSLSAFERIIGLNCTLAHFLMDQKERKTFFWKSKIQFSRQNVRDTEKMLRKKTFYFEEIYNFATDHFFYRSLSFV